MAHALFRPLTPQNRIQPTWTDGTPMARYADAFIKPNDRLASVERLEIYNRTYWFRLIDCMYDDYPGLRAVMGPRRFAGFAEAYLAECPSRSFSLRNLGSRVVSFLTQHPVWTQPRPRLAMDMSRFEWAQVIAFDEGALPPVTPADVQGKDPDRLRLALQPYITLLELGYPLDDFVLAVKRQERASAGSANAVEDGAQRHVSKTRKVRPPRAKTTFLAVHRYDNCVYYKRLEPAAFALLGLLRDGQPLGPACAAALAGPGGGSRSGGMERAAKVRVWFETWMEMGWFCRRGTPKTPRTP